MRALVLWVALGAASLSGCLPGYPVPPDFDEDGFSVADGDCDDGDALLHPSTVWYPDADADGFGTDADPLTQCQAPPGYALATGDCDDADAAVHPDADEHCDGVDEDCDGTPDDDPVETATYYADADGDGYGVEGDGFGACEPPTGYATTGGDCDDTSADVHPDADEWCNGADDDCDAAIDEDAVDGADYYPDRDGDGYGDTAQAVRACETPTGYITRAGDCNDLDAAWNPDAEEADCADPNDYDCDGSTIYEDGDGDGWAACVDCDDASPSINPGATESCNSVDDDCDGLADDADTAAAGKTTYHPDADGDGYGDASDAGAAFCSAPSGYVAENTDCDDTNAAVSPGDAEICDASDTDEDCDGLADDADSSAAGKTLYYSDFDGDGYGSDTATGASYCDAPSGGVANATDCDDTDAYTYAGAPELCDGVQNDCSVAWASDAGTVTAFTSADVPSDATSAWLAGTTTAPASITLPTSGRVVVCDGTWYVALTASSGTLTLESLGGSATTILSGGSSTSASRSVLTVSGTTTLTVDGFTLTDGSGTDIAGITHGGAVYATGGSIAFSNTEISGNTADLGGAVYTNGADIAFDDSLVTMNTGYTSGGAVYAITADLTCSATSSAVDAGFTANTAAVSGGGVYLTDALSTFTATTCDFGVASTADDNSPNDILYVTTAYATYGDDVTVTCTGGSCTP